MNSITPLSPARQGTSLCLLHLSGASDGEIIIRTIRLPQFKMAPETTMEAKLPKSLQSLTVILVALLVPFACANDDSYASAISGESYN